MAKDLGTLVKKAREELQAVTGLPLGSTVGTVKGEKGWTVLVELLEKKSLPDGMDILATYEALVSEDGKLIEFSRKGMRKRTDTVLAGVE